jgi:arylsulfatase A-like enzyme
VLMWGGPVRPADLGVVSARDIAPTVLHLAGLPVSDELDGRVMSGGLDEAFQREHPIARVARYGRRPASTAASGFDAEMVEELRSLGYIQ